MNVPKAKYQLPVTEGQIEFTATDKRRYTAMFEPVRRERHHVIGWATVEADEVTLRFPAILSETSPWVATVTDWQAPIFVGIDLSDPDDVADLISCGQGSFISVNTGAPVACAKQFAA